MIIKIYLLGCIIAFIIELITIARVRNWNKWDLISLLLVTTLSWIYIGFFLLWVLHTMGLQYDDIDNYEFISWRLKRK